MKTTKTKRGYEITPLGIFIKVDLFEKIEKECTEKEMTRRAVVEKILKKHYEEKEKNPENLL
jgi:hypothetical protein